MTPRDRFLAAFGAGASAAEMDALLADIRADEKMRRQLRDDAERVAALAHRIYVGLVIPPTEIAPLLKQVRLTLTETCE